MAGAESRDYRERERRKREWGAKAAGERQGGEPRLQGCRSSEEAGSSCNPHLWSGPEPKSELGPEP